MFGKKNNNPVPPGNGHDPEGTPEGQAGYVPIDDAADFSSDSGAPTNELLASLRAELDEVNDRWKRAMADFQNFQRRATQNEQEARRQGVTSVLHSLIPVLDHFDLAIAQSAGAAAGSEGAAGVIEGVRVIRGELIKALELHGVKIINPEPNAEFNPNLHNALTQQPAEGVKPGRISSVFQVGYELHDRVVRPAKVAVAPTA